MKKQLFKLLSLVSAVMLFGSFSVNAAEGEFKGKIGQTK